MARGYQTEELKQKLIDLLKGSEMGLSGVEISQRLGLSRITMAKYLKIFAAEGLIRFKNVGNVTLWILEENTEQFRFPNDYFKVQTKFQEYLGTGLEQKSLHLIRNCIHSEAIIPKLMNEVIVPAIDFVQKNYREGKIGNSEENLLKNIIRKSIGLVNLNAYNPNPKKNVITIAADPESVLISEAAAASLYSDNWQVFSLGDMSSTINILFDLDLKKFLGKIWKRREGIMIIVVFSSSEEGLNFFADTINSIKGEFGKSLYLALCGMIGKKTQIKSDLVAKDLDTVLQWSQTVYESSKS